MDLTHKKWESSIVDEDLRLISWGFRSKKWMFSTPFGAWARRWKPCGPMAFVLCWRCAGGAQRIGRKMDGLS